MVPCNPEVDFGPILPADLAEIVDAWESLTDTLQAAILAMVRSD